MIGVALDKTIRAGKEHRRPWTGKDKSKNVDETCRNHGSCEECRQNRLYQTRKEAEKADVSVKEYEKENKI